MSPSHHIDFRPVDSKDKKTAILAVISFLDAYPLTYSRGKVSEYFGVNERTVRTWCAQAAATPASQPDRQAKVIPDLPEGRGIKRSRSEDAMADVLCGSITSGSHKSHKATRKSVQGQKKRKTNIKNETITPSPPSSPQQLLTPPSRTAPKRKQRGVDVSMSQVQFADDSSDEYTPY